MTQQAIYLSSGDYFKGTAAADLACGDIVFDEMGRAGVITAMNGVLTGATYQAQACGRYRVNCLSTDTVDASSDVLIYWDAGNSRATTTASSHNVIGRADADKADGETTVDVLLNSSGKSFVDTDT